MNIERTADQSWELMAFGDMSALEDDDSVSKVAVSSALIKIWGEVERRVIVQPLNNSRTNSFFRHFRD